MTNYNDLLAAARERFNDARDTMSYDDALDCAIVEMLDDYPELEGNDSLIELLKNNI